MRSVRIELESRDLLQTIVWVVVKIKSVDVVAGAVRNVVRVVVASCLEKAEAIVV